MTDKELPDWFVPLVRYSVGLQMRPKNAPKPAPFWAQDEIKKFKRWLAWRSRGAHPPRPVLLWKTVPAWAWGIYKEYTRSHSALATAPVVAPTTTGRSVTKGKNGLYYYNSAMPDIDFLAKNDIWVAILVHETTNYVLPQHNPDGLVAILKASGVKVIATGWCEGNDIEGETTAATLGSRNFDEYMANMEHPYFGYDPSNGTPFAKMAPWCEAFRKKTDIIFSMSVEWGQVVHLAPIRAIESDFVIRPQCYMNQYPHMTPDSAIRTLQGAQADGPGLRADQVEACYGKWGGLNPPLSSYSAEHTKAKQLGMRACNVWAGEFCDSYDLSTLSAF